MTQEDVKDPEENYFPVAQAHAQSWEPLLGPCFARPLKLFRKHSR